MAIRLRLLISSALAVGALFLLAGCYSLSPVSVRAGGGHSVTTTTQASAPAGGADRVQVQTALGSITAEAHEGDQVEIRAEVS